MISCCKSALTTFSLLFALLFTLGFFTIAEANEKIKPTTPSTDSQELGQGSPDAGQGSPDAGQDSLEPDENEPEASTPLPDSTTVYSKDYLWLDDFHDSFSAVLDDSAGWLNQRFASEDVQYNNSKAWARVIMGWEPKTGDLSDFPVKFKVKVKLPNLKHNINLVFSDNEAEDFNRLPLETSRPANDSFDSRDFSAAIQLLHNVSERSYFRSRLGIGSSQLYARSSYRWKKEIAEKLTLSVEPSVEYYWKDGAGLRFLTQLSYFPDDSSEIRGTYSIWDREGLPDARWKTAVNHLTKLDEKSTLISGILVRGTTSPHYRDEKITISTRWRRHALRRWLFFEVEPFMDFEREKNYDSGWGVALRVGGYFGY